VGWALADHMRTELVADALSMAFSSRRPPEGWIFHSDRGCQYTSTEYRQLGEANGVLLSLGRKGECWDNAVSEAFFATIKRELIDRRQWPTRAGLRRAVFEYIEGWYNTRRLHSSLGYVSPAEYEAAIHRNAVDQAAQSTQATCPSNRSSPRAWSGGTTWGQHQQPAGCGHPTPRSSCPGEASG
jgi:transposase InsO family protein